MLSNDTTTPKSGLGAATPLTVGVASTDGAGVTDVVAAALMVTVGVAGDVDAPAHDAIRSRDASGPATRRMITSTSCRAVRFPWTRSFCGA